MPSDEQLSRTEKELFMRTFARNAPAGSVTRQFVEAMREARYEAGALIYEQGAVPRYVYFVVSGRVRLSVPEQEPWFFDKLSAIGGLDALQDILHTRTAVAVEDTRCLLIPVTKYFEIIEDNHEFATGMTAMMATAVEKMGAGLPLSELLRHEIADPSALLVGQADRKLGLLERLVVLRQAPLYGRLRSQMIVALAETLEERALEAGEIVLPGGVKSDRIFVVASGQIEVSRIDPPSAHVIGPGHAVALFAAVSDTDDNYRAVARSPSRLLALRKVDVLDAFEDHPDMARVGLAFLARERSRVQARLANLAPPHSWVGPPVRP